MINLNVRVQNVDLQSVLVEWDLLPKYYWNAPEPSYVVLFQDFARGINVSVEIPPGITQLNYTQLKHFTNYSVSLMALNRIGPSLPTEGGVIETLEHCELWVAYMKANLLVMEVRRFLQLRNKFHRIFLVCLHAQFLHIVIIYLYSSASHISFQPFCHPTQHQRPDRVVEPYRRRLMARHASRICDLL